MKYIKRMNEFVENEVSIEEEINDLSLRLTDDGYKVEMYFFKKSIDISIRYKMEGYTLSNEELEKFRDDVNNFYTMLVSILPNYTFEKILIHGRLSKSFAPAELSEGVDFVVYVSGKSGNSSLAVDLTFNKN